MGWAPAAGSRPFCAAGRGPYGRRERLFAGRAEMRTFAAVMKSNFSTLLPHYKATLRLGLPIAVGQLGVIILGFADTMMVGQYSTTALAAASFVTNLFNLVQFLIMGYSYGLTPMVGALYGRGEHARAGALLKNALASNFLFCAVVLSVMTGLYFFLDRLGQPAELLPEIRSYYVVILISMLFVMVFNALRQFTDGTTDTARGMWTLLAGNLLNILGNWLLIWGVGPFPELGLLGAGISTLFSRFFMAVLLVCFVAMGRRYAPYRAGFRAARLSWERIRYVAGKSLPVSLQMGVETGTFTFSAVMAGWLGATELAAYQVIMTLGTLGFLFYYSFGAGMSIRIATFVGVKDWQRVRLASTAGSHIELALAVLASLTFFFFAPSLIGMFSPDADVRAMALLVLYPLMLYQFSDAMQICYANALRGTGHVLPMMWIAVVSYLCVGIPCGYLLGFPLGMGIRGIFLAFSVGLFTAAALLFRAYRGVLRREDAQHR